MEKKMRMCLMFLLLCMSTVYASEPSVDSIDYSTPAKYLEIETSLGTQAKIIQIASELKGDSELDTIRNVLIWVDRNLQYDPNRPNTWRNFDGAIEEKTYGGCADYGIVRGVLLKGAGIPTIWVKTMDVSWIWDFKKGREFDS